MISGNPPSGYSEIFPSSTREIKMGDRIGIVEGRISIDRHDLEVREVSDWGLRATVLSSTKSDMLGKDVYLAHGSRDDIVRQIEKTGASLKELHIYRKPEKVDPSSLLARIPSAVYKSSVSTPSNVRAGDYAVLRPKEGIHLLIRFTRAEPTLFRYEILAAVPKAWEDQVGKHVGISATEEVVRKIDGTVYRAAQVDEKDKPEAIQTISAASIPVLIGVVALGVLVAYLFRR